MACSTSNHVARVPLYKFVRGMKKKEATCRAEILLMVLWMSLTLLAFLGIPRVFLFENSGYFLVYVDF